MNALKVVGARGVTMIIGLLCGFVTTNLVIGDGGVGVYALYSFLVALPALVPFSDLGSGAALVNRIARSRDPEHDDEVRGTLLSIFRILIGSASTILLVDAILYLTGAWRVILGSAASAGHAEIAAFVCIAVFTLSVPVSVGSRIFLGLEKQHVLVLLQGAQGPITLLIVFVLTRLNPHQSGALLSLAAYVSMAAVGVIGFVGAHRFLPATIRWARQRVTRLGVPGTRVMDIGVPVLIQTIATPIATQLDRIILAQFVSPGGLAMYGVAAQLFFALQSLVSTAGITLWPMFARQRERGERTRPFFISGVFASGAAVCAAVVWVIRGPFFGLLTHHRIVVEPSTLLAFSIMLVIQAALYPLGMFLMDRDGARFQVVPVLAMVAVNVVLSIVLAASIGVPGPILATGIATLSCQIIPFGIYIKRRQSRREPAPVS